MYGRLTVSYTWIFHCEEDERPQPPVLFKSQLYLTSTRMAIIKDRRASLVVQWLRVRLPMQGTRVRALVWEDPTCRGATGPVSRNYWACASGACAPQQNRLR